MKFDYIVIGSGIAGLNFALNIAGHGRVLVLTKKEVAESSTNYAQGGIAAVLSKLDSFEAHIEDTLKAGSHHNLVARVEKMVRKAPEAIKHLIEMGVGFDTCEGIVDLRKEGGHSENRILHVGDYTGKAIENALVRRVKEHDLIEVWEDAFVIDVIIQDGKCLGVVVLKNGKLTVLAAKATVLATGGVGQVFKFTTNPSISTGDGFGMMARIGADFQDMEFVQFHPTVFFHQGKAEFLLSEVLRGEGAVITNDQGKRFILDYDQRGELAPRDIVARAVYEESLKGGVYLSFSEVGAESLAIKFPTIYTNLLKAGYNLAEDNIPIVPAAHFICGGVKVDDSGRVLRSDQPITGLYAFGEVAWTGVHGANRLGSNSLLEALVFSNEILNDLSSLVDNVRPDKVDLTIELRSGELLTMAELELMKKQLRELMWSKVGIVRDLSEVSEAVGEIELLIKKLQLSYALSLSMLANSGQILDSSYVVMLVEVLNLAMTAALIAKAAEKRSETLGGHYVGQ